MKNYIIYVTLFLLALLLLIKAHSVKKKETYMKGGYFEAQELEALGIQEEEGDILEKCDLKISTVAIDKEKQVILRKLLDETRKLEKKSKVNSDSKLGEMKKRISELEINFDDKVTDMEKFIKENERKVDQIRLSMKNKDKDKIEDLKLLWQRKESKNEKCAMLEQENEKKIKENLGLEKRIRKTHSQIEKQIDKLHKLSDSKIKFKKFDKKIKNLDGKLKEWKEEEKYQLNQKLQKKKMDILWKLNILERKLGCIADSLTKKESCRSTQVKHRENKIIKLEKDYDILKWEIENLCKPKVSICQLEGQQEVHVGQPEVPLSQPEDPIKKLKDPKKLEDSIKKTEGSISKPNIPISQRKVPKGVDGFTNKEKKLEINVLNHEIANSKIHERSTINRNTEVRSLKLVNNHLAEMDIGFGKKEAKTKDELIQQWIVNPGSLSSGRAALGI